MKIGDIIYPLPKHRLGPQLHLPFWGKGPALIVGFEEYKSTNPNDCQSDMCDERWLVLEDGEILYMTTFLIEQLYESR